MAFLQCEIYTLRDWYMHTDRLVICLFQHITITYDFSMTDNLAYDGVISQIPSGSKPTNQANDGNQTSCFETFGTNIRFQVDLKNINIVTNIYLTGKGMLIVDQIKHFT